MSTSSSGWGQRESLAASRLPGKVSMAWLLFHAGGQPVPHGGIHFTTNWRLSILLTPFARVWYILLALGPESNTRLLTANIWNPKIIFYIRYYMSFGL